MSFFSGSSGRALRLSDGAFQTIEHTLYVGLGVILSLTAILALAAASASLVEGVIHWETAETLLVIIDRLLFVLMMTEILHTVRVSITSGTLDCEPFLIVGLIASIRRVLVITLESSRVGPGGALAPERQALFQASIIELGVLAGLILVMVLSIFLLRYLNRRTVERGTGVV